MAFVIFIVICWPILVGLVLYNLIKKETNKLLEPIIFSCGRNNYTPLPERITTLEKKMGTVVGHEPYFIIGRSTGELGEIKDKIKKLEEQIIAIESIVKKHINKKK